MYSSFQNPAFTTELRLLYGHGNLLNTYGLHINTYVPWIEQTPPPKFHNLQSKNIVEITSIQTANLHQTHAASAETESPHE